MACGGCAQPKTLFVVVIATSREVSCAELVLLSVLMFVLNATACRERAASRAGPGLAARAPGPAGLVRSSRCGGSAALGSTTALVAATAQGRVCVCVGRF